jgi:hypothetical protein
MLPSNACGGGCFGAAQRDFPASLPAPAKDQNYVVPQYN